MSYGDSDVSKNNHQRKGTLFGREREIYCKSGKEREIHSERGKEGERYAVRGEKGVCMIHRDTAYLKIDAASIIKSFI